MVPQHRGILQARAASPDGWVGAMTHCDPIAVFVHQQNINHFRQLLQTQLDPEQRREVMWLLAREEAAEREAAGLHGEAAEAARPGVSA